MSLTRIMARLPPMAMASITTTAMPSTKLRGGMASGITSTPPANLASQSRNLTAQSTVRTSTGEKPQTMDSMVMPYNVLRSTDESPELTRLNALGAVDATTAQGNSQRTWGQKLFARSATAGTEPLTLERAMGWTEGVH